ncbi:hypothetical protein B9Z55_002790 [Caenorhabditis nigoni]|uniref:Ubiquitin-like domain-containing protein n=1 Tax=Caenorhabditis nigoni TaxID=1611254 RepID=A0A2G5VM54_9PELO|nr:hypothetical protein B9Z55_002790 [Caenorhabditis nigoni]
MMELFFELHDHTGFTYKKFNAKFGNQSALEEVQEKINTVWEIECVKQCLFFKDGKDIFGSGEDILQSYGLKNGDKVVVVSFQLTSLFAAPPALQTAGNNLFLLLFVASRLTLF